MKALICKAIARQLEKAYTASAKEIGVAKTLLIEARACRNVKYEQELLSNIDRHKALIRLITDLLFIFKY